MLRLLPLAILLALPLSAQAQMASYCGGAVVADVFDTRVTPGSTTRADYSVTLRNAGSNPVNVTVNVRGAMLDRPSGAPIRINGRQSVTVKLGYQTILPGSQALRGQQLANVTGVSCL